MKRKFTKADRQKIVDAYVAKHGTFDAGGFLWEVRKSNGTHEAWSWFEWNDGKAGEAYREIQAREFVQGLKVKFEVVQTEPKVASIIVRDAPAYISPVENRRSGGGYHAYDPANEDHRDELVRQAATAFDSWVRRYGGIFSEIGGTEASLAEITAVLVGEKKEQAA
jgi:hypothetical protein